MTGSTSSTRPTGAKRRRPMLLSFTALGVAVGLLGVAGVFATSSDRATTGQNDARSGDLPVEPSIDLQLAIPPSPPSDFRQSFACGGSWSDDLTSGVITSDGGPLTPSAIGDDAYALGYVCIRNVGTAPAAVSMRAIDLVDEELTCAPGEAAADPTCGTGVGELSQALVITTGHHAPQSTGCSHFGGFPSLSALASESTSVITSLAPGEEEQVCFYGNWLRSDRSQTDRATWRMQFEGVPDTCVPDDREPNDTFATAGSLTGPVQLDLTLCPGDDDYFRVVSTGQASTVTVTGFDRLGGDGPYGVLQTQVLRPNNSGVAGSLSWPFQQVTIPAAPGTYLIAVTHTTGDVAASYHLSFSGV